MKKNVEKRIAFALLAILAACAYWHLPVLVPPSLIAALILVLLHR